MKHLRLWPHVREQDHVADRRGVGQQHHQAVQAEGLPLRQQDWQHYLDWATEAFRLCASGVRDETQIHTHMCYSEFNAVIDSIAAMDADVITIETSRSDMELLEAFEAFDYPNDIGPGVYDIHSPRVPARTSCAPGGMPPTRCWRLVSCVPNWPEALLRFAGAAAG